MRRAHDRDHSDHITALQQQIENWAASFKPTETALEGGLFPGKLGKGVLGFKYSEFKLSERDAEPLPVDSEIAEEFEQLCGGPIPPRPKIAGQ